MVLIRDRFLIRLKEGRKRGRQAGRQGGKDRVRGQKGGKELSY